MNKNYEKFASVYDAIMDDSLYDKWTDFSLRHFPKNKKKLLESQENVQKQLAKLSSSNKVICSICRKQEITIW